MPLKLNYKNACEKVSDINEHIPTLRAYGERCNHITECGVRYVVSSYAFAMALKGKAPSKFVHVDIESNRNISFFKKECAAEGIPVVFYQQNDLECPIEQTDLLFLDTWHVYGQLKRELARFHSHVNKYIIVHDTTTYEWVDEGVGTFTETKTGLWPAIVEFVQMCHWRVLERFTNNNGLTVLGRIS